MPLDERTPLLRNQSNFWSFSATDSHEDFHAQFCKLVGIPPSDLPPDAPEPPIGPKTLYGRALRLKRNQIFTYRFTAGLSNTMLLSQVILGAALTALGASQSSHILITIFGAMNTIIAGLVAYLKSRGQPMRARMYRDDLERVVDEIENSEIMWLGISKQMHGYSEINTETSVTVRSEVARLTRLYDRAVRSNTMNNPDMYLATGGDTANLNLKSHPLPGQSQVVPTPALLPTTPAAPAPSAPPPPAAAAPDPDESPATAPKPPVKEDPKATPPAEPAKDDTKPAADAAAAPKDASKDPKDSPTANSGANGAKPAVDPDESPATSATPPKSS